MLFQGIIDLLGFMFLMLPIYGNTNTAPGNVLNCAISTQKKNVELKWHSIATRKIVLIHRSLLYSHKKGCKTSGVLKGTRSYVYSRSEAVTLELFSVK